MKATTSSSVRELPEQSRSEHSPRHSSFSSLKTLYTAGLLLVAGHSSTDSLHICHTTEPLQPHQPVNQLVPPPPIEEPSFRQQPLSAAGQRKQEQWTGYPSDITLKEAARKTRGLLAEAMSDTQSVEIPLGHLRDGYTFREREMERQKAIISIIAQHASTTSEAIAKAIQTKHKSELAEMPLISRRDTLHSILELKKHAEVQAELERAIEKNQVAMSQAVLDTQLDKIDLSLSLFRELKSLLEAQQANSPYDAKRLKALSRMCSTHSLADAVENISALERLRGSRISPSFQKEQAFLEKEISQQAAKMAENEEKNNLAWCDTYESKISALEELSRVEAQMREAKVGPYSNLPREVGGLMSPAEYTDFKIDLATYLLRNCRLAVHTLRNTSGDTVATICDRGKAYGGYNNNVGEEQLISIAIDEPDTRIAVTSNKDGLAITASNGAHFESKLLDLTATARTEAENSFTPIFTPAPARAEISVIAEKYEITTRMNPGGVLDLSECGTDTKVEIRLDGSGIIVPGQPTQGASRIPVTIESTLSGEAPLLIEMPKQLTLDDLRIDSRSSNEFSLALGNADFTIWKRALDGKGTDVDVEFNTPRGRQIVAIIRNGENVFSR
jgi:hypothetical protein